MIELFLGSLEQNSRWKGAAETKMETTQEELLRSSDSNSGREPGRSVREIQTDRQTAGLELSFEEIQPQGGITTLDDDLWCF